MRVVQNPQMMASTSEFKSAEVRHCVVSKTVFYIWDWDHTRGER